MPSVIKRKTSDVQPSQFQIYAGDEPRPGGYRGVLKNVNMVKSNGDNLMFRAVVEFQAKDGSDKKQYDGYATFPTIPLTDNESNKQREQAFYMAICGKADADIKVDGKPESFKPGDGQKAKVLAIGGVNPEGKIVNVRMRNEVDNRPESNGAMQLKCDLVFAARGEAPEPEDDDDIEEDETEEDGLPLYEEDDLKTKNLVALRKILVDELGADAAEMKAEKSKAALIALILELQEDEEEDEDDEDDEDEDEDEDEEDEEDDKEAEIRDEVAEMDRAALKSALKKRGSDFRVTTKTTDDALREALVELMLQDPPF